MPQLPQIPGITTTDDHSSASTALLQLVGYALAATEETGNQQSPGVGTKLRQELAAYLGPLALQGITQAQSAVRRGGADAIAHLGDKQSLLAIGAQVGQHLQTSAAESGHGDLAAGVAAANGAAVGAQIGGAPGAVAGAVAGLMGTSKGKQLGHALSHFLESL